MNPIVEQEKLVKIPPGFGTPRDDVRAGSSLLSEVAMRRVARNEGHPSSNGWRQITEKGSCPWSSDILNSDRDSRFLMLHRKASLGEMLVVISTESPAVSGCSGEIRPQTQSHSYPEPDVSTGLDMTKKKTRSVAACPTKAPNYLCQYFGCAQDSVCVHPSSPCRATPDRFVVDLDSFSPFFAELV